MLRKFTTSIGRFQTGDLKDYPAETWEQIARSALAMKSTKKPRLKLRKRKDAATEGINPRTIELTRERIDEILSEFSVPVEFDEKMRAGGKIPANARGSRTPSKR